MFEIYVFASSHPVPDEPPYRSDRLIFPLYADTGNWIISLRTINRKVDGRQVYLEKKSRIFFSTSRHLQLTDFRDGIALFVKAEGPGN